MSGASQSQPRRFPHFGAVLRHYRETVAARLQKYSPGLPELQLSAAKLIECMKPRYEISPAAYSATENGGSLPRDPEAFIDAVAPCLAIERNSLEWWTLVQYAAYDLVAQRLGADVAEMLVELDEDELKARLEERSNDHRPDSHA